LSMRGRLPVPMTDGSGALENTKSRSLVFEAQPTGRNSAVVPVLLMGLPIAFINAKLSR
jgi:hypothetical protein